jgi:hypothetical protein
MSFSDFSSDLEKAIKLSKEIIESCKLAKNNKTIIGKFENKASETLKVLTNLKSYIDHFHNQVNATLLKKLINDIENIKNFVKYIRPLEEISNSKY